VCDLDLDLSRRGEKPLRGYPAASRKSAPPDGEKSKGEEKIL
jgi:hypothetical protein